MAASRNKSHTISSSDIRGSQQFSVSFETEKIERLSLSCNTIIEDDSSNECDCINRIDSYFSKYELNAKISNSKVQIESLKKQVRRVIRGYNVIKDTLADLNAQLMVWEIQLHEQQFE